MSSPLAHSSPPAAVAAAGSSPLPPLPSAAGRPVAAQYCVTFLKPEMLHIYRQITAMQRFRPVVFAQKRENAARFPFEDLVLLPKPPTHALRRVWQKQIQKRPIQIYRREARRTAAALGRVEARLLHIYFGHIAVHLLPLIELRPLPIITSFHGADAMVDMEKPRHRADMRRVLAAVTLVLVRSHSLADRLVDLGCDRRKIRIHRTGIPVGQLAFSRREPPRDGGWKLLQACRLIPKKGLATSLRAFAEFSRQYPGATFTVAGEGPMAAEIQGLAAELGIAAKVRLTGFISQGELRELFYGSHFFLHPSELGRDGNQEGVPNSMLEAMATGLPALATTHGGIPEAVENGINGLLVAERDHAALGRAMLELAADPDRYRGMSAAAAAAITEKFELYAQVRALEGFYEEALGIGETTTAAATTGG